MSRGVLLRLNPSVALHGRNLSDFHLVGARGAGRRDPSHVPPLLPSQLNVKVGTMTNAEPQKVGEWYPLRKELKLLNFNV